MRIRWSVPSLRSRGNDIVPLQPMGRRAVSLGPSKTQAKRIRRPGEVERDRAGLHRVAAIAQVHFEHGTQEWISRGVRTPPSDSELPEHVNPGGIEERLSSFRSRYGATRGIADHLGNAAGTESEKRQVDQAAPGHVLIMERALPEHPARIDIQAAGVDRAERHAVGGGW